MEWPTDEIRVIEEKRLVHTLITAKPRSTSLPASLATVLIMGLVTLFYWQDPLGWSSAMPAARARVFDHGEWWRIFTAIFIHGDFGHYVSNMYMLGIFCFFVYGYFGFVAYPLVAFLSAGLVNALAIMTYAPDIRLLGASGLVYLLGGFWLSLYFFIQRQYSVPSRLLRVVGIGLLVFFPTSFVPTTSYRTHAIGFAVGVLTGLVFFFIKRRKIRAHEVYAINYVESEPQFH